MHSEQLLKRAKKSLFGWLKSDPIFTIVILLIIILSVFFRTYNYTGRVFIQADNSRDVQVARYAADNLKIPQIGQFSSAGPFFYGPWYYWFLEIISFVPLGFLTHWYITTTLYLVFVLLIFWLGKEIGGKWLGALAALFAAISPAQINFSFSVWNPAIIPLIVLITIIFLVRFFKYKKYLDIFLLGFFVGLAISIHFQSILITPTLLVAVFLIILSKPSVTGFLKYLGFLAIGFMIPILPLLYFDIRHHWYNSISLFIYLAVDQYRIWVPNRWLTYIGKYWPETWGTIVGGNRLLGGSVILLLSVSTLLNLRNFAKYRIYYLIAITFSLEVILYRYYRGERYWYYSLFAHPTVIILTAWASIQIFRIKRAVGVVWVVLIFLVTTSLALSDLQERTVSLTKINTLKEEIYTRYPNEKFDIYGCSFNGALVGHPLALSMYDDKRNSVDGVKIGVCETPQGIAWTFLASGDIEKNSDSWFNVSTATVYKTTTEWWKEKPPGGGGNFWEFVKKNLNPKCWPHC